MKTGTLKPVTRIEITWIKPTDAIVNTGPDDEDGLPTLTNDDYQKAVEYEKNGHWKILIRAEVFAHDHEGFMTEYLIPYSADRVEQEIAIGHVIPDVVKTLHDVLGGVFTFNTRIQK